MASILGAILSWMGIALSLFPYLLLLSKKKQNENKKVLITGNTGFKGSWLSTWLKILGAEVYGYSLNVPTEPAMYKVLDLENKIKNK